MLSNGIMSDQLVLIGPDQARWAHSCVAKFMEQSEKIATQSAGPSGFWDDPDYAWVRPYNVRDGVLHIPVKGVLLHDFPYQLYSWATGYAYLEQALQRGLDDSAVKSIAFIINSPGGMVSGCFDFVDKMFSARGKKKMVAIVSEHAYSAAYAVASGCDEIVVAKTGGVGSIGVYTEHWDISKYMEELGFKHTFIQAGKFKTDANEYEPLTDEAKARIQARINHSYGVFVATVARNRGLAEAAVRATEALTYSADDAISVGLADRIGSFSDEQAVLAAEDMETDMTDEEVAALVATKEKAAHERGLKEGEAKGQADERARVSSILDSDDAKSFPVSAISAVVKAGFDADGAKTFLASMKGVVDTTGATGSFSDTMNKQKHPEVGAENGGKETAGSGDDIKKIMADFNAVNG